MQPSEEIKSRLDIVEVIREYINLSPAGINFRANCPFHNEKTPSFMVSPEKQIWHCFGCAKGGDIFSFVMEMEGVDFSESLRILAPKAGVELKKQNSQESSKKNRLLDIVELAKEYYFENLLNIPQAESARKYLNKRGLDDIAIKEWEIGYSSESWDDLLLFLKKKGYRDEEIFSAGISARSEKSNRFYNRFRGRIMFPINNINGSVVAFSARVMPENEEKELMGKYINSPQSSIYDKSRILFALDKAKLEIKKQDLAVIVEGQMDAVSAHNVGFKNTAASSGTALTAEQVKLLKRYTNNIALAFDADDAGAAAVVRGAREAMKQEMNISVIEMPEGKDPDECIRNSPDEWQKAVKTRKPLLEYYFDKVFKNLDTSNTEHKREAAAKILPSLAMTANKIERDFWLRKLSAKIDVSENILREILAKSKKEERPKNLAGEKKEEIKRELIREERLSEALLALLLKFPLNLGYAKENIQINYIRGGDFISIYRSLMIYYNEKGENTLLEAGDDQTSLFYDGFKKWTVESESEEAVNKILDKLALLGERDFYDLDNIEAKKEISKLVFELKKAYLLTRLKELESLISEKEKKTKNNTAEEGGSLDDLMNEFKKITDELGEIEQ